MIIKANTNGSAEAVSQAIQNVKSSQVIPKIMHVGVGDISEADVMLASASDAIILGFSVKEDANALAAAERELVTIKNTTLFTRFLKMLKRPCCLYWSPKSKKWSLVQQK